MQNKFLPENKMSKRNRSALNKSKRNVWGMNPVSRIKTSAKVYNRKRKIDFDY